MQKAELLAHIQSLIEAEYAGSQAAFAQDKQLSAAYVNDVLKGRREPGRKMLAAVGAKKIVAYMIE